MGRPVTLFTGQWADLSFDTMLQKAKAFGYDGLELACWGDHFEVAKADQAYCDAKREALKAAGLQCHAISAHLVGQAVCDNIDAATPRSCPSTFMATAILKVCASAPPRKSSRPPTPPSAWV